LEQTAFDQNFIIVNAKLVTEHSVIEGSLTVQDGIIKVIEPTTNNFEKHLNVTGQANVIDAGGNYVLPGLIDLHGDAIEKAIQPRKKVLFPVDTALASLQAQLLTAGITTMYHALSFNGEEGLRANDMGYRIAESVVNLNRSGHALLDHRVHIRYELVNRNGADLITKMMDQGWVDLFSVMDHTPQYGKYRSLDEYRYYVEKTYGLSGEACDQFIDEQRKKRDSIDPDIQLNLIKHASERGIAVASHDDNSARKIEEMHQLGVNISEFPLNREAGEAALAHGMHAIVGGPNALRGYSHENHLSAREALQAGLAQIICSDYYPFSMLSAVFALVDDGMTLPNAVAVASLNPARAVGLERNRGSIAVGKRADLLIVKRYKTGDIPLVYQAFVAGKLSLAQGFSYIAPSIQKN
jgi:alpha-D-ribose 1-methylphosphonate 5-triphosphate diphosphatase